MEKKKYFHHSYFYKGMELAMELRFSQAIQLFENYLKIYPYDLEAYAFYANTLIDCNSLQEAKMVLEKAKEVISKQTSKLSFDYYILFTIKLLSFLGRYEECYQLFEENIDIFKRKGWNYKRLCVYLRKEMGCKLDMNPDTTHYTLNQIIDYDEQRALDHIKCHQDLNNQEATQFIPNFPLEKIYKQLRQVLPLDNHYNSDLFTNLYIIKYLACGHVKSKLVDYFKVVTISNTNEIITCFPYANHTNTFHLDLTPALSEEPSLKRVSQIDKFYQKYTSHF